MVATLVHDSAPMRAHPSRRMHSEKNVGTKVTLHVITYCKNGKVTKYCITNHGTNSQNPEIGITVNNESKNNNRATALEWSAILTTGEGLKCGLLVPNFRPRLCCS